MNFIPTHGFGYFPVVVPNSLINGELGVLVPWDVAEQERIQRDSKGPDIDGLRDRAFGR